MAPSEFRLTTSSAEPEVLEELDGLLVKAWSENPHVPQAIRVQVGIAVAEIAANIIEYAAGAGPVNIQTEVQVLRNEVRVEFVDDGIPARIDLNDISMPGDMEERGRGLALAQAALARLSYRRDTVNRWTLVSRGFG